MRTYRVAMINEILNFRKFICVQGYSCIDAGDEARKQLGKLGYRKIESIVCIKQFPEEPDFDMMFSSTK